MIHKELSYRVIGCCMEVHSCFGPGLLEQCYHNALYYALKEAGLSVGYNVPFTVSYKEQVVGEYFADLVVDSAVIMELKSVKALTGVHTAQLINYLHIAHLQLGLLVNFQGQRLEWRRLVI